MSYLYDTVITGKTCNKLMEFRIGQELIGNVLSYYNYTRYFYTHTNNDVVYLFDPSNNNFDTLYNFSATIGDRWRMPPLSKPKCALSYVTVTDTGHVTIQGQWLKSFTLAPTMPFPSVSWGLYGTIYERLGAIDMYPYYWGNLCANGTDADIGGPLRCFSDHQIIEYKKSYNGPCDYMYVSVDELKNNPGLIQLYPNPGQGLFTFHLEPASAGEQAWLSITDVLGRPLKRMDLEPGKNVHSIELRDLADGVYIVSLMSGNDVVYTGKVIKQE